MKGRVRENTGREVTKQGEHRGKRNEAGRTHGRNERSRGDPTTLAHSGRLTALCAYHIIIYTLGRLQPPPTGPWSHV